MFYTELSELLKGASKLHALRVKNPPPICPTES